MNTTPRERPRAVTVVGWTWLIGACLRFVDGFLSLFVWKAGGLDRGIRFLPMRAGGSEIKVPGFETLLRHATEIMVLQILAGGAIAWAAFQLLRGKSWARTVILIASGFGIAVAAGLGTFVYASAASMASQAPEAAAQVRMAGIAAGAVVGLLGIAFFGGTILLLRRPDVRHAFEPESPVEPR